MQKIDYENYLIEYKASLFDLSNKKNISVLDNYLINQSIVNFKGKKYYAFTKWNIDWKYNYINNYAGCGVGDVVVNLKVLVTLPVLSTDDLEVYNAFKKFLTNLKAHENSHIDIAKKAAIEIKNLKFDKFIVKSDCQLTGKEFNDKANEIINKYANEEIDMDRITNHGASNGANLYYWLNQIKK